MDAIVPIEVEPAKRCPVCASTGKIALADCRDYLCALPGRWTFFECADCRSLWLNPRPSAQAIPLLYPSSYGFTRTPLQLEERNGFGQRLKRAILAHSFGYDDLPNDLSWAGAILSRIAPIKRRAGYSTRYLAKRAGGKLLDVGCGNGAFMHAMQRLGWETRGLEPDGEAAAIATAAGLSVEVTGIENAQLPSAHFDAITLTHVIEHLPEPRKVFEILARALKPGGVIVSISPNPLGLVRRVFRHNWYELDPPRHFVLPTRDAYRRLLEPLSFEVRTWTTMRMFYWAWKESRSISKHQTVGAVPDSARLKLLALAAACARPLFPNGGEEVVCYARKR